MDLINWFPGHMAKAFNDIKDKQDIVDCFIVLLDGRVPLSSYNDEFDKIGPRKPRLFVFTKSDYTNIDKLNKLLPKFENEYDMSIVVNLKKTQSRKRILDKLEQVLFNKREKDKKKGLLKPRLRCFVIGMPNVGKSTMINLLAQAKKTRVANFAGTTRSLQWIAAGEIQLLDTPGILMPKLLNQRDALKLVATGAIKAEVVSDLDFYYEIINLINKHAPEKFDELGIKYCDDEIGKYNELIKYTKNKNLLIKNGQPDINKALKIIRQQILNFTNIIWD
ncbi:MAG: ribosome biogenesis GTPase YlqF [Mycoplasmataceae bacterium]|nr:ribosome biogenesis GTPase YlqF [Mycoplasmataceae bacterium]